MRSGGFPGRTHGADNIPLKNAQTTGYGQRIQMGIQGLPAIAVIQHNHISIPKVIPAGVDHNPRIGGINQISFEAADVDTVMIGLRGVIKTGNETHGRRPYKCASANIPIHDRTAGARSKNLGHGRILAGDARRAPCYEFTFSVRDYQPGSNLNIGFCVIADSLRVQTVTGVVHDRFRGNAIEIRHAIQSIAGMPFIVNPIGGQNIENLVG